MLEDPQLGHRKMFQTLDHAEIGQVPYTGHMFRISGYDSGPRFAPPTLGQHNEQVLKELLGMTDDEIAEAIIDGALE